MVHRAEIPPNVFTKMCRICMNTNTELQSIYEKGKFGTEIIKLHEVITDCTSIEFDENDQLPTFVCVNCLIQIGKIYKFRQMAFKSNFMLRQNIETLNKHAQASQCKLSNSSKKNQIAAAPLVLNFAQAKDTGQYFDENIITSDLNRNDEHTKTEDSELEYVTVIVSDEDQNENINESKDTQCYESPEHGYFLQEIIDQDKDEESEEIETIVGDVAVSDAISNYIYENDSKDNVDDEDIKDSEKIPKITLNKYLGNRRHSKDPKKSFKCNQCEKTLSNFSSFKYHMQLHSDNTPFLCCDCGEGFKTRNAYDGHMVTHLPCNPNKCKVCGKSYRQAASLRTHMLTHTGEKPFVCSICGKGLTQKSGYKKHMLTHTGEKPHKCDMCQKEFRYSSNLIMHKRSHIGERNFACDLCDKKFLSKEQLKRHTTIHSGEKPHTCDICKKKFNRKSSLQIHQKVHDTNGNQSCEYCGKLFSKKRYLLIHMKTHALETPSLSE